jgi:hypothetical protein
MHRKISFVEPELSCLHLHVQLKRDNFYSKIPKKLITAQKAKKHILSIQKCHSKQKW